MTKTMNTATQYYKDIPLRLIVRKDYRALKARRFTLNGTNQNVWIPCQYLEVDGTIKPNVNIDFVFLRAKIQLELAGVWETFKQFNKIMQ